MDYKQLKNHVRIDNIELLKYIKKKEIEFNITCIWNTLILNMIYVVKYNSFFFLICCYKLFSMKKLTPLLSRDKLNASNYWT